MGFKILHYIYNGPPILSGYSIRTQSIAKAQKEKGLSPSAAISVISLIDNYFSNLNFASKNVYDGICYYSAFNELMKDFGFKLSSKLLMSSNRITNRLRGKFYSLRIQSILQEYYKYILKELGDIDLIHTHAPSTAFNEANIINKFFQKKIIYEVRGFWNLSVESFNEDILKDVQDEIYACQKADKCVAICQGIADILIKGGIPHNKIEIAPNGVDPNKFKTTGKDLNLLNSLKLEDKIIFGYITNVRWFEGIQTIVKAWPNILKEIPNAAFLLIGEGNYLETIRSMIKEYKIEDSFLTLGRIKHEKIPAYYSLLDIFIVPRINVPVSQIVTPLKPLEAMANGKSVVVSDVKALKEMVINGETGLYFKADDTEDLSNVCIQLAKDNNLRYCLSENGRNWVLKNRTWDKIVNHYSEIYDSVLNSIEM